MERDSVCATMNTTTAGQKFIQHIMLIKTMMTHSSKCVIMYIITHLFLAETGISKDKIKQDDLE